MLWNCLGTSRPDCLHYPQASAFRINDIDVTNNGRETFVRGRRYRISCFVNLWWIINQFTSIIEITLHVRLNETPSGCYFKPMKFGIFLMIPISITNPAILQWLLSTFVADLLFSNLLLNGIKRIYRNINVIVIEISNTNIIRLHCWNITMPSHYRTSKERAENSNGKTTVQIPAHSLVETSQTFRNRRSLIFNQMQ